MSYTEKIASIKPSNLILHLPLNESSGLVANDISGRESHGAYASSGITYGVGGIGDGQTGVAFDGNDTYINIDSVTRPFDTDWNGNLFSMVAWGKVDGSGRWSDATTYRYMQHIRAADATYYAVMGKSTTDNQLEWRRRTGGVITSYKHTFSPAGPLDWFCMGMTCDQSVPELIFYLNDSVNGWRKLSTSNSAYLTDWGNNPPVTGATVMYAGSLTLQEWIGSGQHSIIWNDQLSDSEMEEAMTL